MLHQAEVAGRQYAGQRQLWQHPYAAPQPRAASALASVWFTDESALVRLVGGDNRLTAVVLGGVSLALAAELCSSVTEPEETQAVSVFSSSVNRVPSTRLNNGPSAAAFRLAASSETFVRRFVSDQT